ncbi:methyltransferase domain-containing protein [Azotobacter vinelandii]|uniref:methyltransferase domain-containing protein n=1 Tax=Azotobacter vinelandii TaxID=354 RepID=UPI0007730B9D|nr:class I SAM-dependent methyltransferase [Azotobacter vinelandii]WKN19824.1 methyltransferase domain-containing protein [Azotobacter vinelandii]
MSGLINWELLMQLTWPPALERAPMWDGFARRYDGYTRLSADYVDAQVDILGLRPDESLLDVGAGPGRLAIPAARRARQVTALDISRPMLDELERNAAAAGVDNIQPLQIAWDKVLPGENVPLHDVVLLSRSPAMRDLAKVDALARRAAYVMLYSGPSLKSFHDRLVAGIEETPPVGAGRSALPGHALIFNRLLDMGIEARVDYLADGFSRWYPDEEAAVADFAWLDLPAGSEARLRANLAAYLQEENGGLRLRMETRTAVVWWCK